MSRLINYYKVRGIENSFFGKKHLEETKKKISEALKGKKKPPRTKEHIENLKKNHINLVNIKEKQLIGCAYALNVMQNLIKKSIILNVDDLIKYYESNI